MKKTLFSMLLTLLFCQLLFGGCLPYERDGTAAVDR